MITFRRSRHLLAALAFAVSLARPACGAEAEHFVQAKLTELTQLLRKAKSAEDVKNLDAAFDAMFDYRALDQAAMQGWSEHLSPAQRTEFAPVLNELVRHAFLKDLRNALDCPVVYQGEEDGDGGKIVHTVRTNRKNAHVELLNIDYVVHPVDGQWLIQDILTEGGSMARVYRMQFKKIMDEQGFDHLLKRMLAKRDEGRG